MRIRKKQRKQQINEMLLQMASGNFFYRIALLDKNDQLEGTSILLNMLAEEIQDKMKHEGYLNSQNPIIDILQLVLVLDENGTIVIANQIAHKLLSGQSSEIIGKPFETFLESASQDLWSSYWKQQDYRVNSDTTLDLKFKGKGSLIIPKTCYITYFNGKENSPFKTLITTIYYATTQEFLKANLKQRFIRYTKNKIEQNKAKELTTGTLKPRLSREDIDKIGKARHIMANDLEKDFPTIKDFALELGTNEYKLKYGFKELYGITIHRFLLNERLRKAKMLLEYTQYSIKTITLQTGFKSSSHFSRCFKKHYEFTPSQFRKKVFDKLKND
tara:strand:+ start:15489 stop:16478 length:990 start_codon:yes stop_codon:yes gene_type:complete